MKKAKIVLSAVAVFAVIGGAFAFKASRVPQRLYYATASTAPCTNSTVTLLTTTNIGTALTYYSTAPTTLAPINGVCKTFTTVFN